MSKNRPPLVLVETAKPILLPERDQALLPEMLGAYQVRRLGALRHHPKSVGRDLAVIGQMLAFTGKPPWRWTEQDFKAWCHHLGIEKELARPTQRHYQATIRRFQQYLIENHRSPSPRARRCDDRPGQHCGLGEVNDLDGVVGQLLDNEALADLPV